MKSRYCYSPMTAKRIGRRMTMADRFRSWMRDRRNRKNGPDIFPIVGYNAPIYPGK